MLTQFKNSNDYILHDDGFDDAAVSAADSRQMAPIFPDWVKILPIFILILYTANAEHSENAKFIEFFSVLEDPLCFIWLPFQNGLSYRAGIGLILKRIFRQENNKYRKGIV